MPCREHVPVLRRRRFGPFESFAYQCLQCGRRVGYKVPRGTLSPEQIAGARLWNTKLRAKGRGTARSRRYQAYLASPKWRKLRATILARDSYVCAFCGEEATEVHHLSYARFGNERETDLASVCRDCNLDQRQKSVFHRMMGTHNLKGS